MDSAQASGVLRVALDGELTIQSAAEQRHVLAAALEQAAGCELRLDLQDVHGCDSAGIQLLLAARLSQHKSGGRLVIEHAGKPVNDVLRTYGLQALFDPATAGTTPA